MPRTIDEGFRDFLSKLTPSGYETEAAISHRRSIESCLRNKYQVTSFNRTGSFGNGTSISGYSDVDYFVGLKGDILKQNSDYTLQYLRETLKERFTTTPIRVSSPAVVLDFGDGEWERTEITPADYLRGETGKREYDIPDGKSGWMNSGPEIHKSYVNYWDDKFDKKLKPLIRFIKAWKYFRDVKISSFYIEIFVTNWASIHEKIFYPTAIQSVLNSMWTKNCHHFKTQRGYLDLFLHVQVR